MKHGAEGVTKGGGQYWDSWGYAGIHQGLVELFRETDLKVPIHSQRMEFRKIGKLGINISILLMRKLRFIKIRMPLYLAQYLIHSVCTINIS